MCSHTLARKRARAHTHTHTHTHTRMHARTHTCAHAHTHSYTHRRKCAGTHNTQTLTRLHTRIHTCISSCLLQLAFNTIGSDTARREFKATVGGSDQQQKQMSIEARLVYHQKARPMSHRVQAAAYRAYGSLSSKGLERPRPKSSSPSMSFYNTSTSVIESMKG